MTSDNFWNATIRNFARELDLPDFDEGLDVNSLWEEFKLKVHAMEKRHALIQRENLQRRSVLKGIFFGLKGCGRYLGQLAACGTQESDYGEMLYCPDCRAGNEIRERLEEIL